MFYTLNKDKRKFKFEIKIEDVVLDKTEMVGYFKAIAVMKSAVKKLKKDTPEYLYLKDKIRLFRNELSEYGFKLFKLNIKLGNHYLYEVYSEYPSKDTIKSLMLDLLSKLKQKRIVNKNVIKVNHEMNGIAYTTVGSVFEKEGEIMRLQEQANNMARIRRSKKPHPKIKDKYIGVELELLAAVDRNMLEQHFLNAKLAGNVYIKDDGSINREKDKDFPHEVTILVKQDNFVDIIRRVCEVLNNPTVNAYVNNSCGMHVHFDVRNRNSSLVFKNLVRLLPLLQKMVPETRTEGSQSQSYCAINNTDIVENSKHPFGRDRRYQAINPESIGKYNTVEVRIHSGTTNAAKIINWIKTCLFAVDNDKVIDVVATTVELNKQFNVSSKLLSYIEKRIELFSVHRRAFDTRADHFHANDVEVA